ncbi:hypothetical protein FJ651_06705 [Paucihalobacter ruber]|uniref:SGNH/GDSL hydrolase family protein n=1 Tax=Paucihalobacter ruber TaxID=2567861 RepID=A0A506PJ46_9FLAO|nr:hypothetical protein [Paucihalobacter ruber]TPV33843.1 hypothetical protein FJ651_06705 [Paucihalobacter ruber]
MKRFIWHIIGFILITGLSCYIIFMQADGYTDAFYVKFTTPKQNSLIVGSSRAAQGLQPNSMSRVLPNYPIYNYAFSRIHTPYGKPYLESIKLKLKEDSKKGIFIVEVNPWSICKQKNEVLDSVNFRENNSFLGGVKNVSVKPNLEYLMNFYEGKNVDIFTKKGTNYHKEILFVHDDGWYEVNLNDSPKKRDQRINSTITSYSKIRTDYQGLSDIRLDYLKQTIDFLQYHGKVFMVRMPVHSNMLAIEKELMPDFDQKMLEVSMELELPYFNFTHMVDQFQYTDGHHLDIDSGSKFSVLLAQKIVASQ